MSFENAGAIADGVLLTMNGLRPAPLEGKRILVYGASGSIGTEGVQLTKHSAITSPPSATPEPRARAIVGADEVIDYLKDDFTETGGTYDVVFDAVGRHWFRRSKRASKPGGIYLPTDGFGTSLLWLRTSSRRQESGVRAAAAHAQGGLVL